MEQISSNIELNTRVFVEVRHAGQTSLTLKETAKVFSLRINGKKMEIKKYLKNFMHCSDDSVNVD